MMHSSVVCGHSRSVRGCWRTKPRICQLLMTKPVHWMWLSKVWSRTLFLSQRLLLQRMLLQLTCVSVSTGLLTKQKSVLPVSVSSRSASSVGEIVTLAAFVLLVT